MPNPFVDDQAGVADGSDDGYDDRSAVSEDDGMCCSCVCITCYAYWIEDISSEERNIEPYSLTSHATDNSVDEAFFDGLLQRAEARASTSKEVIDNSSLSFGASVVAAKLALGAVYHIYPNASGHLLEGMLDPDLPMYRVKCLVRVIPVLLYYTHFLHLQ